MKTISATDARNNIAELWKMASDGPVAVENRGVAIAYVVSPTDFERLNRRPRQFGTGKDLLKGVDPNVLLAVPLEGFEEYM